MLSCYVVVSAQLQLRLSGRRIDRSCEFSECHSRGVAVATSVVRADWFAAWFLLHFWFVWVIRLCFWRSARDLQRSKPQPDQLSITLDGGYKSRGNSRLELFTIHFGLAFSF